jgi:hypothetical protein
MKGHRNYKTPKGYLDRASPRYRPMHEASFIRKWMIDLTSIEPLALSLLKPFDPFTMRPILRKCSNAKERALFNYFRVALSSEDQNYRLKSIERGSDWMVFDEVSGTFLGLFAIAGATLPWGPFTEWAGGVVGLDCRRRGHNTMHMVLSLRRCIPLYDFGAVTGGKLIALLATSTEVIQMHELQYSLVIDALLVKTTHGKSSQYNRLHPRGIEYRGLASDGAGVYIMAMRENAKPHLLDQCGDPGARLSYSADDQVAYWKERWLPNRVGHLKAGLVVPDPERYRLSGKLNALVWKRYEKNKQDQP